jgi:hypothetical protein
MPFAVVSIRARLTPPKRGCALRKTEAFLTIRARYYRTPASTSSCRVFNTEKRLWLPTARTRKARRRIVVHLEPSDKRAIDVAMMVNMPRRGHGRVYTTHVSKTPY